MKKFSMVVIAAAAVAISLASCQKNALVAETATTDGLKFTSEKPALEPESKTAWTGETIQWVQGDKIRVAYTCDGVWQNAAGTATSSSEAKMYESKQVSADAEKATFEVPGNFTGSATGTYEFYGVYPSSSSSVDFNYAPSATINIPTTQTPQENSFDSAADIMIAKSAATYTGIPAEAVSLMWDRMVAHAQLTFKTLNGFTAGETIKTIELTANAEADMVGVHYITLDEKAVTKPSSNKTANAITLNGDNLKVDGNGTVVAWASFLPCTITSLKVVITTNAATYTRDITGINVEFKKNARNTLPVNMTSAVREEVTASIQLVPDGLYVIAQGNNMMTVGTTSNQYRGFASLPTANKDGSYNVSNDAAWEISYDTTSDTYTIKSVSENVYLNGAANASDFNLKSEATSFTITLTEQNNYRIGVTSGTDTRYIGYNTQTPRFAMYKGSVQQLVDLNLYPAVVKLVPTINVVSTLNLSSELAEDNINITFTHTETAEVKVYSDAECTITDGSWLTAELNTDMTQITYMVDENTTGSDRVAYIQVYALSPDNTDATAVIKVTQKAAGSVTDWSKVYTSNVAINGSIVKINGEDFNAIQVGSSNSKGAKTFKIPAGTTKLHLHVVGWNKENGKTHTIETSVGTISSSSIITTADTGATSNSPFTLSKSDYSGPEYYYEFTLTDVTSEATITVSNSAGKSRGVYFGINAE